MDITEYCMNTGFEIVHTDEIEESPAKYFKIYGKDISMATNNFLFKYYRNGIYKHQKVTFEYFLDKKNVCITTKTASGKSLCFYLSSIELIQRNRNARIIAIYPTVALSKEQEERWIVAIRNSGVNIKVGRIKKEFSKKQRLRIINESNVVLLTPDIMHAWLFSNIGNKEIIQFLQNLKLVIVDEVHMYTGIFGSNSAFLFRRLNHALSLLGQSAQFLCASATIADTQLHLSKLFGMENFHIVDKSMDTSPQHCVKIYLLKPPQEKSFFQGIKEYLSLISEKKENRFIVFVDSRKQAELLATILNRENNRDKDKNTDIENIDELKRLNILPFRAGYEEKDREIIQERFTNRSLTGIISTSALELGMDIPDLNICILIGVPNSLTSFYQRIGRIGRHSSGTVMIIHQGTVFDETIFSNPSELMKRPFAEGSLYLENTRIQYINALCLSRRNNGEHDQLLNSIGKKDNDKFKSNISWPSGFIDLCNAERFGEISQDLWNMKIFTGDIPNHVYPLRDIDKQFKLKIISYHEQHQTEKKGELSYSQVMREAYPGAVYLYATQRYRIFNVNIPKREISGVREKKYAYTSHSILPPKIFTDFNEGNIIDHKYIRNILLVESKIDVQESINGFAETIGSKEIIYTYPLKGLNNVVYNEDYFSRTISTTGVIITHPVFNNDFISLEEICNILLESFLIIIPYEKRDIACAYDKFHENIKILNIFQNSKYIVIYDQTYGSLRLTNRIMCQDIFLRIIEKAIEIMEFVNFEEDGSDKTKEVLNILYEELRNGS